ncbi:MAG: Na+:solute symporter [Opitutales bacterium]|jgi:solute:Na+ symporter, SSS family|nr:Na+:solute symporter [Opitutales bacterium]MBT5169716.1 Na+:solute symporter [Opitutales bacterium]MBT5814272.1 Na+:solute symporter [Opitutales bacterium]MBT7866396.1 Na+:solute symporter [Opitutales bacterium]
MQGVDYFVILLYVLGIIGAGMMFAGRMKSSKEMFSAGGQSPWWVSGLSGFMTQFSAGTFVVWGGVAYRYGFVAIVINLGYGVAAMMVGRFVAGHWRRVGVDSASEFLHLRFGGSVVQFYTWFKGTATLFTMGGGVYALSKIVCVLVPLPVGHVLADPATGFLSVTYASVALCLIVILITFIGGLWAVLMTDVLQFVILMVSVIFVVPLILMEAGGWGSFLEAAPKGFMSPVAADFTWWFITGWMIVNFFNIGAEWTFVQRYLCVPEEKDARKSAYLFGALYFVSPILWMLPPLIYRVLNSEADSEQAYILACQLVLPAGMVGLMVAAMASATASMATTRLNVFAGAFTSEVYHRIINQAASEKRLVFVGRAATIILGCVVLSGALLIPKYGYTSFLISINALLNGPLMLPTIWGLFSRKIGLGAVWATILAGFLTAFIVKFGLSNEGFLNGVEALRPLVDLIAANNRIVDLIAGIVLPLIILVTLELRSDGEHPGWQRVLAKKQVFRQATTLKSSTLPGKMVVVSLAVIAVVMFVLSFINREESGLLIAFAIVLGCISGAIYIPIRRTEKFGPN